FNALTDQPLLLGPPWDEPAPPSGDVIPARPTMFDRLGAQGIECTGYIGDLAAVPGRWSDAVVHGMTRLSPRADWERLRHEPPAVAAAVADEVDTALRDRRSAPLLVWTYVHIDPYIHDHGFDGAVVQCLRDLDTHARRWSDAGCVVVAH